MKEHSFTKCIRYLSYLIIIIMLLFSVAVCFLLLNECYDQETLPFFGKKVDNTSYIHWPTSHIKILKPLIMAIVPKEGLGWNGHLTIKYLKIYTEIMISIMLFLILIIFVYITSVYRLKSIINQASSNLFAWGHSNSTLIGQSYIHKLKYYFCFNMQAICATMHSKALHSIRFSREGLENYCATEGYIGLIDCIDKFSALKNCDGTSGNVIEVCIQSATCIITKRQRGTLENFVHEFDLGDGRNTSIESQEIAGEIIERIKNGINDGKLLDFREDEVHTNSESNDESEQPAKAQITSIIEKKESPCLPSDSKIVIEKNILDKLDNPQTKSVEINVKFEKFEP